MAHLWTDDTADTITLNGRKLTAVPRRLADTRRARDRLGFEARVSLDEGLRRLVAWWAGQTGWKAPAAVASGGE